MYGIVYRVLVGFEGGSAGDFFSGLYVGRALFSRKTVKPSQKLFHKARRLVSAKLV